MKKKRRTNPFRNQLLYPAALALLSGFAGSAPLAAEPDLQQLEQQFKNPPLDTRPGCYWYWINDNISTAGLTKDLEAMARVGIGRAYIGHIFDYHKPETSTPPGDVKFMSDQWWTALQWAVKEADRCGITIGFFNSPGWSQSGAPWVKPNQSMRYLAHSETTVFGGGEIDKVLPVPDIRTYPNSGGSEPVRRGPNFTEDDFQDVRVVAFRQPDGLRGGVTSSSHGFIGSPDPKTLTDGSDETYLEVDANKEQSCTFQLPKGPHFEGYVVQSAIFHVLGHGFTFHCKVEMHDGTTWTQLAAYKEERGHQGPKNHDPIVVPFTPAKGAEHIRLTYTFHGGGKYRLAEVNLTDEALLAGYVRKQLAETSPHTIIPVTAYQWDTQTTPAEGTAIASDDVVDLSDKMDKEGRLRWRAPDGQWKVLRMGMVPIGTMSAPASDESRGLEIDKMSTAATATIFEGMVGEFLRRTPAEDRKALKYVIADSYETGPQNWTDNLLQKFEARFGYSPTKFLPVMAGQVVDSPGVSDRFLWDLRRLIVESVAYDYVGGLRDISNKNGLLLWLENYGHWGFISEFLLYGSQTDEVGGEIWESSNPISNVECRAPASSAHIYGKNDVYAETFTSSRSFKQSLATLKRWCDWAFGTGINHHILHVYIHQPDERKPGIIEWFGTAFNRHNTWFDQSKAFIDYLRRGAVMLKAGKPVADVAYYIGENSPSMTGAFDPPLPSGYDFDHINSDVLINQASVSNGRITLKSGMSYAVLVLPRDKQMRPEVAEAIRKLVKDGAVIIGPRPDRSPSLQDYPAADDRVKAIAAEVWGNIDGTSVKEHTYGSGRVYEGVTLAEVLRKHDVLPDVELVTSPTMISTVAGTGELGVNNNGGLLFKHRQAEDYDVYFLSNTSTTTADIKATFRVSGLKPYLWNALSGESQPAGAFRQEGGRTMLPLQLDPSESVYVVFGGSIPAAEAGTAAANIPELKEIAALDENWTVQFAGQAAPEDTRFAQVIDWAKHPAEKIRHFSGSGTYTRNFDLPEAPAGRLLLDLGNVSVIATVTVNGQEVGTLWTNPWQIDISRFVRTGTNNLQVRVANTWNNRLVADAKLPADQRASYVSQPYRSDKENPLLPGGILGPIRLLEEVPSKQ